MYTEGFKSAILCYLQPIQNKIKKINISPASIYPCAKHWVSDDPPCPFLSLFCVDS